MKLVYGQELRHNRIQVKDQVFNSIFTPKTKQNAAVSLKKNSSSRQLLSPKNNSYKDKLIFVKRDAACTSALESTQQRKQQPTMKPQFLHPSMKNGNT